MSNGRFFLPLPSLGKSFGGLCSLLIGQAIHTSRFTARPVQVKRTVCTRAEFDFVALIATAIETFCPNRFEWSERFLYFRLHKSFLKIVSVTMVEKLLQFVQIHFDLAENVFPGGGVAGRDGEVAEVGIAINQKERQRGFFTGG